MTNAWASPAPKQELIHIHDEPMGWAEQIVNTVGNSVGWEWVFAGMGLGGVTMLWFHIRKHVREWVRNVRTPR